MKNKRTAFRARLLLACILSVLLLSLAALTVSAEDAYGRVHDPNAPRIVDNLNLLSDSFKSSLQQQIKTMQTDLNTDFVVVTTNDLSPYDVSYYGIQNYADDFYDYKGYGIGSEFDGTILVIFISQDGADRLYKFEFTGSEKSRFASEIEHMESEVVSFLSGGNYEKAVQTYFDLFERKHHWYSRISILKVVICVAIASLIGLIYLSSLKKKMKTVQTAVSAQNYLVNGTYNLRTMNEVFVRSAVTRTARQKSSSSGGGGGSHFGSSGVSHTGGGGRF